MYKGRTLRKKMLAIFIPLVLLSGAAVSAVSYFAAKDDLETALEENMTATSAELTEATERRFVGHERIGDNLSALLTSQGTSMEKQEMAEVLEHMIWNNEDTLGAGIWYEPYAYEEETEFTGPYVYKDGEEAVYTEAYEEPDYDYPSWEWYEVGMNSEGDAVWTEPYDDEETGITMLTTSVPFMNEAGEPMGVVTADIDLTTLQEHIGSANMNGAGYAFLTDNDGQYIAHPERDKVMSANAMDEKEFGEAFATNEEEIQTIQYNGEGHLVYQQTLPTTGWTLSLAVPERELYAPLNQLLTQLIIYTIIVAGLGSVIIFIFSGRLTRHLNTLKVKMGQVSDGDLTVNTAIASNDEMGILGRQFNKMIRDMNELLTSMRTTVFQLRESSEQMSATSEETTASSQDINKAIQEVAETAASMAEQTEETDGAANELAASIDNITDRVGAMTELSKKQETDHNDGLARMTSLQTASESASAQTDKASTTVNDLSEHVQSIESVIGNIEEISEQTNLLALNASIEAARAGEHGKGFAVVAGEVRKLSEQTSDMTSQIKERIASVKQESEEAVTSMKEVQASNDNQKQAVTATKDIFERLTEAAKEMAEAMHAISGDVTNMNEKKENIIAKLDNINASIEQAASASEEISASTDEQVQALQGVAETAEQLHEMSEEADQKVRAFHIQEQQEIQEEDTDTKNEDDY
ncbi:methyl-accepting chemotaxis protein [Salibacterium aidingense]|uniref:methyl-accepting chemotaxis protein n=1 Tax=Salibacterium aidingense TaxID=384933 RepID=UPI00047B3B4F|nr:methyl-accepting chemotaxis protein [Salibacterium aidingense]